MVKIYNDFIEIVGESIYSEPAATKIIEKYRGVIMGPDDEDIIIQLWQDYGFSGFENGLFWLVNPDEYNQLAWSFEENSNKAIVFARTATGNLFLWEWLESVQRPNIVYFNVHTRERVIKSNSLESFINSNVLSDWLWKEEFFGEVELQVIEKFGPIAHDEAVVYIPALALGGEKKIENMEAQKIIPHLMILSQL